MEKRLYTTTDVLKITEEKSARIQYWILNGIVKPEDPSAGTGTSRQFSFQNLLQIFIAQSLSRARIWVKIVAYIMHQIARERSDYFKKVGYVDDPEKQAVLSIEVINAGTVISRIHTLKEARESLNHLLGSGSLLLQINLDVLKKILVSKLSAQ